jgi:hypothetical protein
MSVSCALLRVTRFFDVILSGYPLCPTTVTGSKEYIPALTCTGRRLDVVHWLGAWLLARAWGLDRGRLSMGTSFAMASGLIMAGCQYAHSSSREIMRKCAH